jgi:hypothetical protein
MENRIMNQFQQQHGMSKFVDKSTKAHYAYKEAADAGDKDGKKEAIRQMQAAGATEKEIDNMKKNVSIPAPVRVFKSIATEV